MENLWNDDDTQQHLDSGVRVRENAEGFKSLAQML